ncbi:multidrug efflux SMR transporter [Alkalihalobacillus sp. LMS39]|uniref:DMT family transporter n=1 Tax=Alkalihalobacillus sp. LMS39 TaxID=2924032 RepID=UPI001FB56576|nr:multidrug efflux SMR transporter [Alkalihalobacillus sp. LMS39]UOE96397.1 multidrug efflux SMR transporter [Alkalihalobacillus sp. LMS39]
MKESFGLTKVVPSVLLFVFYGLCFSLFAIVVKTIDLSVAYAIWAGVGTLCVSLIGMFYYGETVSVVKLLSISLIIIGVIGLKIAG